MDNVFYIVNFVFIFDNCNDRSIIGLDELWVFGIKMVDMI